MPSTATPRQPARLRADHGGAGYIDEFDVSRVFRDIRRDRVGAGADDTTLDAVGRSYGF